jgi:hypothetical protein
LPRELEELENMEGDVKGWSRKLYPFPYFTFSKLKGRSMTLKVKGID